MKENSVDLRNDPLALQRLKEAAEKAKIELSSSQSTVHHGRSNWTETPCAEADESKARVLEKS